MRSDEQSAKLKQRLGQWQTYVEQERSQLDSEWGDTAVVFDAEGTRSKKDQRDQSPQNDTDGAPERLYQERLVELNRQLESERAKTEKLTTEFYQELMRRRKEGAPPRRARARKPRLPRIFAARLHARPRKPSSPGLELSIWTIVGLSVLIAGLCSLIVLLTNQP